MRRFLTFFLLLAAAAHAQVWTIPAAASSGSAAAATPSAASFSALANSVPNVAYSTAIATSLLPANAQYASPGGTGTACTALPSGTPCSLAQANANVQAGSPKSIVLYGGTYPLSANLPLTYANAGGTIMSYPGQTAIIDGLGSYGITVTNVGGALSFYGITFNNLTISAPSGAGTQPLTMQYNTFNNCTTSCLTGSYWASSSYPGMIADNVVNGGTTTSTAAFAFGYTTNMTLTRNHLMNLQGQGINFASAQSDAVLNASEVVTYNLLEHLNLGGGPDNGAIYMGGGAHNATHNLVGWNVCNGDATASSGYIKCVYLDDNQSYVTVIGNIGKVADYAFQIHGGDHNLITQNIWIVGPNAGVGFYQSTSGSFGGPYGMASNQEIDDVIYAPSAFPTNIYRVGLTGSDAALQNSSNSYYCASGCTPSLSALIVSGPFTVDPSPIYPSNYGPINTPAALVVPPATQIPNGYYVPTGLDATCTNDSSAAIQAAMNSMAGFGGTLYIPAPNGVCFTGSKHGYKINTTLTLVSGVSLVGDMPGVVSSAGTVPEGSFAPNSGTWFDCTTAGICATGTLLRGSNISTIGFYGFTTALSYGGNATDGLALSKLQDIKMYGGSTGTVGLSCLQCASLRIDNIQERDVNQILHFSNQNNYDASGNTVISGLQGQIRAKSAANSNNTVATACILLDAPQPTSGTGLPLDLIQILRPQCQTPGTGGDGTGYMIAMNGSAAATTVFGISIISPDLEGQYATGIYCNYCYHNTIIEEDEDPVTAGAVYFQSTSNSGYNNVQSMDQNFTVADSSTGCTNTYLGIFASSSGSCTPAVKLTIGSNSCSFGAAVFNCNNSNTYISSGGNLNFQPSNGTTAVAMTNNGMTIQGTRYLNLSLGGKYECTHGSNGTCGVATLSSGTATVSTTAIGALATSGGAGYIIKYSTLTCSNCGEHSTGTVTSGTSFVINSTNASDASTVYWEIFYVN